jgi:hypothetical protein
MSRHRRSTTLGFQFVARPIEMLESPAYRALSATGHRALSRIEIELANHGGKDNGRLPVTSEDFEQYGMDPKSVAPAVREVEALGFVEVTERGRPSKSDFKRHPNRFRLTYLPGMIRGEAPTNEWKRHETIEMALDVARRARKNKDPRLVEKAKARASRKTESHPQKFPRTPPKMGGKTRERPPPKNGGTVPPPKIGGTSISPVGEGEAA